MNLPQLLAGGLVAASCLLPSAAAQRPATQATVELPVLFVQRDGAVPSFETRIPGLAVRVERDGWSARTRTGEVVRLRFDGARAERLRGEGAGLPWRSFRGGGETTQEGTAFPRVRAEQLLPGVDLVFRATEGRPEYDLVLSADARAEDVTFHVEGAESATLDDTGRLHLALGDRALVQRAPVAFECDADGVRHELPARFVALGDGHFGYRVDGRTPGRTLVIDPVLVWSQMVGGSNADEATAVAMDADGATYVAGWVRSGDFPGADHRPKGRDVLVFKLTPDGRGLSYVALVGGAGDEEAHDLAVDDQGRVTVVGWTRSKDFPATRGALQGVRGGGADGFAFRLAADGATLEWATYFGGSGDDELAAVTLGQTGTSFVTGTTSSGDFPVTSKAFQQEPAGGRDAFVAQLGLDGKVVVYSTRLGGMRDDYGRDVALDANGNAYVVGRTDSVDFPTTTGALDLVKRDVDGFVAKLSLSGAALSFSTFLGWEGQDEALAIAIDATQEPWVAGWTQSSDLPVTGDAMQATRGGMRDGFVARLAPSGGSLRYATYVGGPASDEVSGLVLDPFGAPWVVGRTASDGLPVTPDAAQEARGGGDDAFVVGIDAATGRMAYGTYLGYAGHEEARAVAADPLTGAITMAGIAFDVTPDVRGRLGGSKQGPSDAMLARFEPILCGRAAARRLLGGPAGVVLDATLPRLGQPFRLRVEAGPPAAPGYVLLGPAGAASTLLEGFAELQLDPNHTRVLYSFVTDGDGNWQLDTTLPRRSSMCGTSVVLQAVVLDRTAGPLSFGALSEGVELTLGD